MILLLVAAFLFSFPSVQTKLAHRLTSYLNKTYHTDIQIDNVDLSYFGRVKINGIFARDTHRDTIVYIGNLNTSIIDFNRFKQGKPRFNSVGLSDVTLKLITYKGETNSAFDQLIDQLDGEPTGKPSGFLMTIAKIDFKKGAFRLFDYNKQDEIIESFDKIYGQVYKFKVNGPIVNGEFRNISMVDKRDLEIKKMDTDFGYSKTQMDFKNTILKTEKSEIQGNIAMHYQNGKLSDFNNKVQITADLTQADVALVDMKRFYKEFGTSDVLHFTTQFEGTLNDFTLINMDMYSDEKAVLKGNYRFINGFNTERGFKLDARIDNFETDYAHLKNMLPNLLGKTLPNSFANFGRIHLQGHTKINVNELDAFVTLQTKLGTIKTDLIISNINNIENSPYDGSIEIQELEIGKLLGEPLLDKISMTGTVVGKGFTLNNLDTKIDTKISKMQLKGYSYSNIAMQGVVRNKKFSGNMQAQDPNLKMTFRGMADLSKEKYVFDFETCIFYAELNKLNLFKRDKKSVLKGDVKVDMIGNTLENMIGSIDFRSTTYTNQIQNYFFEDFSIKSQITDGVQNIDLYSTDIVSGSINGKFLYAELPKLAQNAFGSVYTNYEPFKVTSGQYLDFKFNIYNQAIAVFFPQIKLGTNTFIRGEINADEELFKLSFRSPEVTAYGNYFEKIRLQIDNKNPLLNTQLSIDYFKTELYQIRDFNLVNVTLNDTLYFRSEFKGGANYQDHFNLVFFHTITDGNRSVLTMQDSDFVINGTKWNINPDEKNPNRIIYDPYSKLISYDNFHITSNGQSISFYGEQKGENYRNYNIDVDRVQLSRIMPDIPDFDIKGILNGGFWIEKRNNMLIPKADIQIIDLTVNDELQGDLVGEIKGGKSNKEYVVSLSLEKGLTKNLMANGKLDFSNDDPMIYMVLNFNNFHITPLNALGKGVIENIRGTLSGEAGINGKLKNPVFSGDLLMSGVGMYFPYINVDYRIGENAHLYLENKSFVFDNTPIFDTKFNTKATIKGRLTHQEFKKWSINLKLDTDNLLALNTPETDDALFYGTGYMEGLAFFNGYTDKINIAISGSSNPGTEIIIPMSDLKTVETSRLIHFKNPEIEKSELNSVLRKQLSDNFKGVTMNFDFDINKNATIKIVIDKTTGSFLKGTGKGNILMDIDTKGTFNMYGDYIVSKGIYNFKYGGLINKPFTVKSGGSISFNGDPYRAELDIEAVYTVKANPKVLLPEYNSSKSVPVELTTKISGELFNSTQEFEIAIPNAGIDLASELEFVLNKQDSGNMMRQFVSLIAIGNFFDENNFSNTRSAIGNEGITSATMAISNALMDIISDPNDKIQFGFDYVQGNQNIENLYTENQLGVSFSTRLGKNENIIINGEVSVPTGNQSNSNIAGTVSAELPLNKKETFFLKMFNRQNEIQYSDDEVGYTQGFGVLWQLEFDKLELKKKDKKDREDSKKSEKQKDSIKNKETNLIKSETPK